jgi:hypothetical protein
MKNPNSTSKGLNHKKWKAWQILEQLLRYLSVCFVGIELPLELHRIVLSTTSSESEEV